MRRVKVYAASTGRIFGAQPENYGDNLMSALLPPLFNLEPQFVEPAEAQLISVGSLLDIYYRRRRKGVRFFDRRPWRTLHIWGSGFIGSDGQAVWPQSLEVHAVRGPLSRVKLELPELALGDPALLLPRIWPKLSRTESAVAIVPHFVLFREFCDKYKASLPRHWKVVDLMGDPAQVTAEIAGAEMVLSSSLHGLIVADAYGRPSIRLEADKRVKGDGFKYRDYEAFRGEPFVTSSFDQLWGRSIQPGRACPPDDGAMMSLIASFPKF